MGKPARGARKSAPFFGPQPLHICAAKSPEPRRNVAQGSRSGKKESPLVDAVIGGERVKLFTAPVQRERAVEIRIRAALSVNDCVVLKHVVEPCWGCGKKPTKRTGLGKGFTDLFVGCQRTGRVVFVEVKLPGYSPSDVKPEQREFMRVMRKLGFVAGIATNEDEALALVAEARRRK